MMVDEAEFVIVTTRSKGGGLFSPAQDGDVLGSLGLTPTFLCLLLPSSAIQKHF